MIAVIPPFFVVVGTRDTAARHVLCVVALEAPESRVAVPVAIAVTFARRASFAGPRAAAEPLVAQRGLCTAIFTGAALQSVRLSVPCVQLAVLE